MRTSALLCSALVLIGCDRNEITGPTTPLNTDFTLAPGEATTVDAIGVRFLRVLSDSRCPIDAVCVSAGDAAIQMTVSTTSGGREYELRVNAAPAVTHDGFTVRVLRVDPYPESGRQTPAPDYRATFRVTR